VLYDEEDLNAIGPGSVGQWTSGRKGTGLMALENVAIIHYKNESSKKLKCIALL
jgi:hypothetical protein